MALELLKRIKSDGFIAPQEVIETAERQRKTVSQLINEIELASGKVVRPENGRLILKGGLEGWIGDIFRPLKL